jgi:hypothetical protein
MILVNLGFSSVLLSVLRAKTTTRGRDNPRIAPIFGAGSVTLARTEGPPVAPELVPASSSDRRRLHGSFQTEKISFAIRICFAIAHSAKIGVVLDEIRIPITKGPPAPPELAHSVHGPFGAAFSSPFQAEKIFQLNFKSQPRARGLEFPSVASHRGEEDSNPSPARALHALYPARETMSGNDRRDHHRFRAHDAIADRA